MALIKTRRGAQFVSNSTRAKKKTTEKHSQCIMVTFTTAGGCCSAAQTFPLEVLFFAALRPACKRAGVYETKNDRNNKPTDNATKNFQGQSLEEERQVCEERPTAEPPLMERQKLPARRLNFGDLLAAAIILRKKKKGVKLSLNKTCALSPLELLQGGPKLLNKLPLESDFVGLKNYIALTYHRGRECLGATNPYT